MPSSVNGLPLHPLVIHVVVVLVPLGALGLILVVARRGWRRTLGWWLVVVLAVAAAATWAAKESGEELASVVGRPARHATLGEGLPYFVAAMFITTTLFVVAGAVWDWRLKRSGSAPGKDPEVTADTGPPMGGSVEGSDNIEALLSQTAGVLSGTPAPQPATTGLQSAAGKAKMPVVLKILAWVAVAVAVATAVQTFRVGQSGAEAVWGTVLESSAADRADQVGSPPSATESAGQAGGASTYTMAEVATRNSARDCWTVIDGEVYDLTSWIARHPGGEVPIESLCGVDGTAAFTAQHEGAARPIAQLDAFTVGSLAP